MNRCVGAVALVVLQSCATPEPGYEAARYDLRDGDLLSALVELDSIGPGDRDYVEARALARAVERRLRAAQDLMAQGMLFRAEWRDEEAIRSFEQARAVWPRLDGVDQMIRATRFRVAALVDDPLDDVVVHPRAGGRVAVTRPVIEDPVDIAGLPDVTASDGGPTGPPPAPIAEPDAFRDPEPGPAADPDDGDLPPGVLRAWLERARRSLVRGELNAALDELERLHERAPEAIEVSRMYVRVLHQKALLHYGQGELTLALIDWRRLLELNPEHRQALDFRRAAQTELDADGRL